MYIPYDKTESLEQHSIAQMPNLSSMWLNIDNSEQSKTVHQPVGDNRTKIVAVLSPGRNVLTIARSSSTGKIGPDPRPPHPGTASPPRHRGPKRQPPAHRLPARRSFRLEEEWTADTTSCGFLDGLHEAALFESREMRSSARVHVVRSDKTTAQIRDAEVARQNESAQYMDKLFDSLHEALAAHGVPFDASSRPIVAGLVIDSHFSANQNLALGYAALEKGNGANDDGDDDFWAWARVNCGPRVERWNVGEAHVYGGHASEEVHVLEGEEIVRVEVARDDEPQAYERIVRFSDRSCWGQNCDGLVEFGITTAPKGFELPDAPEEIE
ncbi:putative peptidase family-domain-containing protein [Colletotrichum navitas]|uniref:Peptidase family-domain-containing protein n=1 Tax=Colletotrichum navitas TaxID=681940 RepID=A0AAD8V6N7_9PEZI|nr:putative peptidase family-domain-containing protein [Colletotrichum navitas]KAK1593766.1 putative peptidase family-domain-containing protein [Colletotrichum navitas]